MTDGSQGSARTTRQLPPFHCPYCGDEELTPHGDADAGWHCGACLRTFTIRLTGSGVTQP